MADLITDGSLIGFWPLNESSGSPSFRNYSKSYGGRPSGISFDFQVHNSNSVAVANDEECRTFWPGTDSVYNNGSGTFDRGYRVQGSSNVFTITSNERVLVLGEGGKVAKVTTLPPPVAQSGFTVGFWVNPQTNGYQSVPASETSNELLAERHALLGQFSDRAGYCIGVSGLLANCAQNVDVPSNQGLAAFVHIFFESATASVSQSGRLHINTPIESGRFTHLTMSYRHQGGGNNTHQVVLYKNGRVAASGLYGAADVNTPTKASVAAVTGVVNRPLTIGGSQTTSTGGDYYINATGWGHLVSGVYYFNRVLPEGEILSLHDAGGLQIKNGASYPEGKRIDINDSRLLAYYPFVSTGYVDASMNRRPLIAQIDEGDESTIVPAVGPFNRGGARMALSLRGLIAGSGLTQALADAGSFTICALIAPEGSTTFVNNMLLSYGVTDGVLAASVGNRSMGFYLLSDANQTLRARFFNGGNPSDQVNLFANESGCFKSTYRHVSLVYDDQTFGVALYVNGSLNSSGTMPGSMKPQMQRIAGSGFPLLFLNGVDDVAGTQTPDVFLANGGIGSELHEIAVFGAPLRQDEINFMAQSGIDITKLYYTPNDPRLRGYWKGTESAINPFLIPDRARVFDQNPGNLTTGTSDALWNLLNTSDTRSAFYRIDYFGQQDALPPELASYGNLGLTSGIWTVSGGSEGNNLSANAEDRKSSLANFASRYTPQTEVTTIRHPHSFDEHLISFEVTPSGNIPKTIIGTETNSLIFDVCSDYNSNHRLYAFLTTINAPASGVSIVFYGKNDTAATNNPLVSGNIPFGVPSRITFYTRSDNPYYVNGTGSEPVIFGLYVSGVLIHERTQACNAARVGDIALTNSILTIGGFYATDNFNTLVTNRQGGLGKIYVRNFSVLHGKFSNNDVLHIARSGLYDTTSLTEYNNQQTTSVVTIGDPSIQGYWRFSGNQSGTLDITGQHNLTHLARTAAEAHLFASNGDNAAHNLRYVPGPYTAADLDIQCSGITYEGNDFNNDSAIAPFAVSGTWLNNPNAGFSVGFWHCPRTVSSAIGNTARYVMGYGLTPNSSIDTTDVDASWSIFYDDLNNIKMVLSKDGRMYYDGASNVAKGGSVECGKFRSLNNVSNEIENFKLGLTDPGFLSAWNHYVWTFNGNEAKCYSNGILVDQKIVGNINTPTDPTANILNFLIPQVTPWTWNGKNAANTTLVGDFAGILSDVFYFTRVLNPNEIKYIAYNGIADSIRVTSSGMIGGYIYGMGQGSGYFGGYLQGQDTVSGIIGGFITGSTVASGYFGGYISGIGAATTTISGIIGGYLQGIDSMSGLFGGFLSGADICSGIFGGYLLGGLSGIIEFDASFTVQGRGSKSFDAFATVLKNSTEDFDAKVNIFQTEQPPLVQIINPPTTLTANTPLDVYFIGQASGYNGKSISYSRWHFGDLSGPITVSASGDIYYPVSHTYRNSGIMLARFEAVDSDGMHSSDLRIINLANGIDPVNITLSGVPRSGPAGLVVDFDTVIESKPSNVSIVSQILYFDDGQTSSANGPTHSYSEPGLFNPVWVVRDSRGCLWSDSLNSGSNN